MSVIEDPSSKDTNQHSDFYTFPFGYKKLVLVDMLSLNWENSVILFSFHKVSCWVNEAGATSLNSEKPWVELGVKPVPLTCWTFQSCKNVWKFSTFNSDPIEPQNHIPCLYLNCFFFFFWSLGYDSLEKASASLHHGDKYDFGGWEPVRKLALKLKPKPNYTKQSTTQLCQH